MAAIEVFFLSSGADSVKASRAWQWWVHQPRVKPFLVTPTILGCDPKHFRYEAFQYCDRTAENCLYIMADDHLVLQHTDMIQKGLETLVEHTKFAVLANWPIGRAEYPGLYEDLDVVEQYEVSGIRFVRRDCMTVWPYSEGDYDWTYCERLRTRFWSVGTLQHVRARLVEGATTEELIAMDLSTK